MTAVVLARIVGGWRSRRWRGRRVAPGAGRRRLVWLAGGLVLLVTAGILVATVPVPILDGYLTGLVTDRVTGQVACPGVLAKQPTVTLKGGRIVPQLLRRRLSEVRLS